MASTFELCFEVGQTGLQVIHGSLVVPGIDFRQKLSLADLLAFQYRELDQGSRYAKG